MDNIKIDDNNFFVSYLQGILKQYYSTKIILSNFYDYNTHQNLIDFIDSYKLTTNREIIKLLKNDKTLVYENKNIFKEYFSISDNIDYILLRVNNIKKVDKFFNSNYNYYRRYLIKLLKDYGWIINDYNLYDDKDQYIMIQSLYPDMGIIREDLLQMINLYNEQRILSKYKLNGTGITYDSSSKLLILNYNQDEIYTICSKNFSGQNLRVALSVKSYNDIITNIDTDGMEIYGDLEYTGKLGDVFDTTNFTPYNPISDDVYNYTEYQTMIIELPYSYSDTLLILESSIDKLLDTNLKVVEGVRNKTNTKWLDKFYFNDPWLVHKELLQVFLGNTINKYSSEENIKYIQDLYKYINVNYNIELQTKDKSYGFYDDVLKQGIKNIQKINGVLYCNGTVNTETEELLLRGSE